MPAYLGRLWLRLSSSADLCLVMSRAQLGLRFRFFIPEPEPWVWGLKP
jgi:hypothetical protein